MIVVNVINVITTSVNRQCVQCVLYRMCSERSESSLKRAKWHEVRTEYVLLCHSTPLLLELGQTIRTCMYV